jgi:hypothetical protein
VAIFSTPCGIRVPPIQMSPTFVLGSKGDILGLGNLLYNSMEELNHAGTRQIATTPIISDPNAPESIDDPLDPSLVELEQVDVSGKQKMLDVQPISVLSTVSSPDSWKAAQPTFFSRDAKKEKRKRGRPKKISRGRSKGKGSLTFVDAPYVSRELFRDAEQLDISTDSSARRGAVIPIPAPQGASGICSSILSTVRVHGEGNPTPILVEIGTTQGTCFPTKFVGLTSTHASFDVVPEVGCSMGPVGPSNSFVTKQVFSSGKYLGACFKGDDVFEESRLVDLEV